MRVLTMARTHVPRWLAHVDRIPPAELIENILTSARTRTSCGACGERRRGRT